MSTELSCLNSCCSLNFRLWMGWASLQTLPHFLCVHVWSMNSTSWSKSGLAESIKWKHESLRLVFLFSIYKPLLSISAVQFEFPRCSCALGTRITSIHSSIACVLSETIGRSFCALTPLCSCSLESLFFQRVLGLQEELLRSDPALSVYSESLRYGVCCLPATPRSSHVLGISWVELGQPWGTLKQVRKEESVVETCMRAAKS